MTHIRSRLLLATMVAGVSLASVAHAQSGAGAPRPRDGQGPAGMMRRGGPGGGPGGGPNGVALGARNATPRGGRGNPAAMMLRMRSQLQLTDDQVKKLEALQAAPMPRANEADLLRARADLLEATQGDANIGKARAALDRMSALRNERMIAGLRQRQDARAVLTAEQKTRLDNMRAQSRARGLAQGPRGGRNGLRNGQRNGQSNGLRGGRGMQRPGNRGQFGPGPSGQPALPPR